MAVKHTVIQPYYQEYNDITGYREIKLGKFIQNTRKFTILNKNVSLRYAYISYYTHIVNMIHKNKQTNAGNARMV